MLRVGLVEEMVAWFDGEASVYVEVAIKIALTFPAQEAAALRSRLSNSQSFLEFGAGGSTLLAAQIGVPQIVSVESDAAFLEEVARQVGQMTGHRQYLPLAADIGPTGAWGSPIDESGIQRWPDYSASVWRRLTEKNWKPDLVLIDGRFRVACFLQAALHLAPGAKILFDDYRDREHYWPVSRVLEPAGFEGRMAVFDVPQLPADVFRIAGELLPQFLLDAR